jgi:xylose isomerase
VAVALIESSAIAKVRSERYRSFAQGAGLDFTRGSLNLTQLRDYAADLPAITAESGKQELLENIVNQYLFRGGKG